jgi:Fanconi-associated nuclease 1
MCILAITDRNVLGGAAKAIIERLARVVKDIEMDDVLSTCKRLDLVEGTIAVEIPSETITRTKIQSKRGGAGGKSSWVSGVSDEDGKTRAVNVEDITLEHFNELGWKGFHCEGSALTTLYGLLFFDIIFSNVPGVFKNAYQTAPLDYGSESFYSNRKKSIDDRLVMIESEFDKTLEMIRECWTENHKVQCVGVNWELCELDEIICIAKGLGTNLSKILGVMAKFVKRRSGLPDLLLYREEEDGAVVVKMVEVKGPGDSLMSHQSVWIGLLLEMGVDVSVCKVVEAGGGSESGKRKRKEMEG